MQEELCDLLGEAPILLVTTKTSPVSISKNIGNKTRMAEYELFAATIRRIFHSCSALLLPHIRKYYSPASAFSSRFFSARLAADSASGNREHSSSILLLTHYPAMARGYAARPRRVK